MHWEILIVPLIAFAVWILSSLLKEAEEPPKGRPRGEGGPQRPRRSSSEADRALGQRRPQRPEPERRRASEPMPSALQQERQRERAEREEQRRTERRPQPVPPPPPQVKPAPREATPAPAPGVVLARPAPLPPTPPAPAAAPAAAKPQPAPAVAAEQATLPPLMQLLRSPQSARVAMILREIIDPPLCRRPRRPHH